jgi:hypothetical protein
MPHIFASLNKATGQTDLVKADSKSQATKFLVSNFVITRADPVQVAEAITGGAKLYDATGIQLDKSDAEDGAQSDKGLDGPTVVGSEPADGTPSDELATASSDKNSASQQ